MESPLVDTPVPSPVTETSRDDILLEDEQLELFPELSSEEQSPKNLADLKNGNKTMRFVSEYFLTNNAMRSYLAAGYNCTEESARRLGSRLLARVDIQAALAHLDKKILENALVSKQSVVASILRTRERAFLGAGPANLRIVNECDRLLAQIKGMLRDKVEVSGDAVGSLAELKMLVANAKKEDLENVEKE